MNNTKHATRLFFLDWVRIIAFFILILYHVGMYYVTWDWHVKSPWASDTLEPFMMLSSPWRLALLFLVSGVASGCMIERLGAARFARQRSRRLLLPLVFGMLVIVPPQSYCEVVEKLGYAGSYADFMRLYLGAYHGFCKNGACLVLPTWNHLWFVAYLWVYTLVLAALVPALGARLDRMAAFLADLLAGWKLLLLPAAVLALARITLAARYPENHALAGDWYNHATCFFLFALGSLLARVPQVWPRFEVLRWHALGIALACWAGLMAWTGLPDDVAVPYLQVGLPVARGAYALCTWSAIVAACGFAHRHLQFDGPARRYLTEAVFPVYIVHQTLIVTLAHALKVVHRAPGIEAAQLVVLTLCLSFGVFEVVRRSALLRPLFGLAPAPAPAGQARPLAAGAA
jgi:surface polysaccharide O-acyltransferase-like enzyme